MTSIFTTPANSSSDPFSSLRRDHDQFRYLYQQYRSASSTPAVRQMVLNELIRGISIHDVIEQLYLYPAVKQLLSEEEEAHYMQDHIEAGELLYQIDHLPLGNSYLDSLLNQLMVALQEHMEEEEQYLFPRLSSLLSPREAQQLKQCLDQARVTAPTHPHPGMPLENGPLVLPLDKAIDSQRAYPPAQAQAAALRAGRGFRR